MTPHTQTQKTQLPLRFSRPPIRSSNARLPASHTKRHRPPDRDMPEIPEREWDRCSISATQQPNAHSPENSNDIDLPLPNDAPNPASVARAITMNTLDILLGHRPPSVLRPWLAPDVFAILARRASLALRVKGRAPKTQRPRIANLACYPVHKRAVEVAVVAHDGRRGRAIAMRLEYRRTKWRVVALEIG